MYSVCIIEISENIINFYSLLNMLFLLTLPPPPSPRCSEDSEGADQEGLQ